MTPSPSSARLRSELRRRTLSLVAIAALLAAAALALLLPAGEAAGRAGALILGVMAGALTVVILGSWYLRRPLRLAIETLESEARAAETLRLHAERLVAAGRLAAGLAHEVGNPLCAVTNYAHALEEKVPPELRATVGALQRAVWRIERIMDGFLDHARPRDPGSLGADVNDAVRETLSFLSDQGVLRRVGATTKLHGKPLPVAGRTLELEQIFANLVLNAVDAMPGGGALVIWTRRLPRRALVEGPQYREGDDPAVLLRPRSRDERLERWVAASDAEEVVKVVVADSGHGVARGDEERIFEPFVTTKAPDGGSGLGLSIVRRLVEAMSGIVWVQRSREGGAAFHLVLPVHVPPPPLPR